jgi:hypothetical protein
LSTLPAPYILAPMNLIDVGKNDSFSDKIGSFKPCQ